MCENIHYHTQRPLFTQKTHFKHRALFTHTDMTLYHGNYPCHALFTCVKHGLMSMPEGMSTVNTNS